jgi:hypothetical protein
VRRTIAALLAGEALLLAGFWLAWHPLALVVAGAQVVAAALLRQAPPRSAP